MKEILSSPWRRAFFFISVAARMPLLTVPVLLLLGYLGGGVSPAESGAIVAAVTIGAALTGIVQGPLWDRINNAWLYFILSFFTVVCLTLLAFLPAGVLAGLAAFLYGFTRPHTSTVVRSIWINEFSSKADAAEEVLALDVAAMPALGIIGPLLAGGLYHALGFSGGLLCIVASTVIFASFLSLLMRGHSSAAAKPAPYWSTLRSVFSSFNLGFFLGLALLTSTAIGAIEILLGVFFKESGELNLLSPALALSALSVIAGGVFYKRIIGEAKEGLLRVLFLQFFGMASLACFFLLPAIFVWPGVILASIALAPLSASLYSLIEASVGHGRRAAAFSLLASAQFAGVALGQFLFAQIAEAGPVLVAMLAAAFVQLLAILLLLRFRQVL